MSKKRFYNDKKRDTKWTEEPQGRRISFADKYIDDGAGNKAVNQPSKRNRFSRQQLEKAARNTIIAVLCFCVIGVGYVLGDVHILRHRMPTEVQDSGGSVAVVDISLHARLEQPLSFDGGTMLSAVIGDLSQDGFSSVCLDLKREDGTVGYQSSLATISAYGAIASPAGDLAASVTQLKQNDILPVGRICVWCDNVAPKADSSIAVTVNGSVYEADGFTYLNPDSDAAYSYLKGIIEEAKGLGIEVFVLDGCDLPGEIADDYNDGFDALVQKLYADLGDGVRLLKAINLDLTSEETDSFEEVINENASALSDNGILVVTTESPEEVKSLLDEKGLSYIIIV